MLLAQVVQDAVQASPPQSDSGWRTAATVAGAAAGISALTWNVLSFLRDRRPRIRVAAEEIDGRGYPVLVTVTNVGQTTESVREIGLGLPEAPGTAVDDLRKAKGRRDGQGDALRAIAAEIRDIAPDRGASGMLRDITAPKSPGPRAWPMGPGALAEAEFNLALHPSDNTISGGGMQLDGARLTGELQPYARLASGKVITGNKIAVRDDRIRSAREAWNR